MTFGREVLSQPLLVEAIETCFVPVAIHNNAGGRDEEILTRFHEPAWNNPVVRFVDADGRDLLPRRDGVWSLGGITARTVAALGKAGRPVPRWLGLLRDETAARKTERITFAMHCFWEGEVRLGALEGVVGTRAGWLDGREVVEVTYDPAEAALDAIVRRAAAMECASGVYATTDEQLATARTIVGDAARRTTERARDAKASDRLHRLRNSPLRALPLTPLQAVKVNAALGRGEAVAPWLSPTQARWAEALRRRKDGPESAVGTRLADLPAAWERTRAALDGGAAAPRTPR